MSVPLVAAVSVLPVIVERRIADALTVALVGVALWAAYEGTLIWRHQRRPMLASVLFALAMFCVLAMFSVADLAELR